MYYFIFLSNTSEFCINVLRLAVTPFSHLREKMTDANHLSCFQKQIKYYIIINLISIYIYRCNFKRNLCMCFKRN